MNTISWRVTQGSESPAGRSRSHSSRMAKEGKRCRPVQIVQRLDVLGAGAVSACPAAVTEARTPYPGGIAAAAVSSNRIDDRRTEVEYPHRGYPVGPHVNTTRPVPPTTTCPFGSASRRELEGQVCALTPPSTGGCEGICRRSGRAETPDHVWA